VASCARTASGARHLTEHCLTGELRIFHSVPYSSYHFKPSPSWKKGHTRPLPLTCESNATRRLPHAPAKHSALVILPLVSQNRGAAQVRLSAPHRAEETCMTTPRCDLAIRGSGKLTLRSVSSSDATTDVVLAIQAKAIPDLHLPQSGISLHNINTHFIIHSFNQYTAPSRAESDIWMGLQSIQGVER
jgi:hypothetical protein